MGIKKFRTVFKEKQNISEMLHQKKVLSDFKEVYSNLLEQYEISDFNRLNEGSQKAFIAELQKYWSEDLGISQKGKEFLRDKSSTLTESSTELQKRTYLKNKATSVIEESLRQTDLKNRLYSILDEMYKNTNSEDIKEVLPVSQISSSILESFGKVLEGFMTEIVFEISDEEELNEVVKGRKSITKKHPDLFFKEKSLTKRLSVLLTPEYHNASLPELKDKAMEVLNLEDTIVSDKKKKEVENNIASKRSKESLQMYIANLVLKGGNLGLQ